MLINLYARVDKINNHNFFKYIPKQGAFREKVHCVNNEPILGVLIIILNSKIKGIDSLNPIDAFKT